MEAGVADLGFGGTEALEGWDIAYTPRNPTKASKVSCPLCCLCCDILEPCSGILGSRRMGSEDSAVSCWTMPAIRCLTDGICSDKENYKDRTSTIHGIF